MSTSRPYDLSVPETDLTQADRWWASLSINQMKAFRARDFPHFDWNLSKRAVHQVWENEGKPAPQALIPVA